MYKRQVLYELLAGIRPSALHETSVATSATTLRRPSEQLATLPPGQAQKVSHAQGLSVQGMRVLLGGDLDWIVRKAMSYDRRWRYASASDLVSYTHLEVYKRQLPWWSGGCSLRVSKWG